jgi:hypothetical protein
MKMTSLFIHSALASALLLAAMSAQAASMDFETSDSDTIVVGATTEKVTLRVTGYKNLAAMENAATGTKLGTFYMSTNSGVSTLAVTYAAEHNPIGSAFVVSGTISNGTGNEVKTFLNGTSSANNVFTGVTVDGTPWVVLKTPATMIEGGIYTSGAQKLSAGVYPITLRAALYQP